VLVGDGVVVAGAATVDVDVIEVEFAASDAESRHLTPFRSNPVLQTIPRRISVQVRFECTVERYSPYVQIFL